jgi:hypothetical protein
MRKTSTSQGNSFNSPMDHLFASARGRFGISLPHNLIPTHSIQVLF